MQSMMSKVFMKLLRFIFHSPLSDSSKLSDNASKLVKNKKSKYKPSKGFIRTVHNGYEKLESLKCKTDKVVLLIHGGGFKIRLIDSYRRLAEKYSRMLNGATVINVDYKPFPQYQLPSQMHDVASVYLQILKQGTNPENIIIIGDSAGANLALTSSLWLRDNGYPLPCHIVCFSLWGDATASGESRIKNAYTDPFYGISKKEKIEDNLHLLRRISKYALNVDRTNPYISPCFGSFEGFPSVTLVCGTAELDESDNDTVYSKMKKVNVDVELYKFEGMCHDFQLFSFLQESKEAYRKVFKRINGGK
ncbi:MAG: alpha/beta hydrolase fold domain-containing protein [Clostridia bacterium]|nr:alpha/beta hydrolase fold domain-containing protein [Clostridia bacterium]